MNQQEEISQGGISVGQAVQIAEALAPAHTERQHHKYGMSKLNYLDACAGYTARGGTSQAAEDGTRLHEIMDKVVAELQTCAVIKANAALRSVLENETISEDEEFYLESCCKELDYWLAKPWVRIIREENVAILRPDGTELNNGYFDVAIFLSEENVVLFDWKFGWIPVPPAEGNLQGMGYSTAFLQKYPKLKTVGFVFVQPKLHKTTRAAYRREQLPEMYQRIRDVIARVENPEKTLRPGMYCDYCAVASTCTALLNPAAKAVAIHEGLPMPTTFTGLQINTPEEAARALYVLDRLEVLIQQSGLKERAKELARNNGGVLSSEVAPGQHVVVELRCRNAGRTVNSPALIADALKDVLTPEQVLSACDPKITRLEEIFADTLVTQRKAEADAVLAAGGTKEQAKSIRITKKQAREILSSTLHAEGLLSAPGGQVEYLKVRVEKQAKHINEK